jgi:hypothetical protein
MEQKDNIVRFYYFISGVLVNQERDPVCCRCKAFENTVRRMKEGIAELDSLSDKPGFSEELVFMIKEARERLGKIVLQENSAGQKKAGNCKMPEGVCFVKFSKSVLRRLQEHRPD